MTTVATGARSSVVTLREGQTALDDQHPWPGLAPYEEHDHEFFHGRSADINQVYRLLRRNRVTLLFGRSGLGKTSLLKAGMFPLERAEDALPVYVRLDYSTDAPALGQQVKHAIADAANAARMEGPAVHEADTLWEYLHRAEGEFWSENHRIVLPLLVFDQFEELFSLGMERRAADCNAFISELSDLIEDRTPAALRDRLEQSPDEAQQYDLKRHHYKILLSLREDFLPELEQIRGDLPPSLLQNRWRLTTLSGQQAKRVVTEAGGDLVTPAVAENIVRAVAGGRTGAQTKAMEDLEVDPSLLSLFCRELNAKRDEKNQPQITQDLLTHSKAEILLGFYERGLRKLPPGHAKWRPDVLRANRIHYYIEEELLTEDKNYRDTADLGKAHTYLSEPVVKQLVDRHILQYDDRGPTRRVELAHDVLTAPVQTSGKRRRVARRMNIVRVIAGVFLGAALWAAILWNAEERRVKEATTIASSLGATFEGLAALPDYGALPNAVRVRLDSLKLDLDSLLAVLPSGEMPPVPPPPAPTMDQLLTGYKQTEVSLNQAYDRIRDFDVTGAREVWNQSKPVSCAAPASAPDVVRPSLDRLYRLVCENHDLLNRHIGLLELQERDPDVDIDAEWMQIKTEYDGNADTIRAVVDSLESRGNVN